MRTTRDIANDVLQAARGWLAERKTTIGKVISELARSALTASPKGRPPGNQKRSTDFRPFLNRGGIVTNELIDRLREDDAYLMRAHC